jgi:alpha-beta hydrolase superfamily lysophospholipase
MFDAKLCADLRNSLPDFSMELACNPAGALAESAQIYLEFYGFLEVLKDSQVDYFWGYRTCPCGGERMRIATHFWRLPGAKGTVFVVHGLFDHVGLFQPLINHLLAQQYSVVAMDLPGHGLSDGAPTVIRSFADYGAVLEDTFKYFRWQLPEGPVYGLGQSTGAAVFMAFVFACARRGEAEPFARLVFYGPLVRPRAWYWGKYAYRWVGRFIRKLTRDFSAPNSHDATFHNFLRSYDPLQARSLSIEWIGALHEWVEGFDTQPRVDTHLLIVQGTADRVVDWQYNLPVIQRHFPRSQVNLIEGAMHHLANEADTWRKAVFTSTTQFLRQRTP